MVRLAMAEARVQLPLGILANGVWESLAIPPAPESEFHPIHSAAHRNDFGITPRRGLPQHRPPICFCAEDNSTEATYRSWRNPFRISHAGTISRPSIVRVIISQQVEREIDLISLGRSSEGRGAYIQPQTIERKCLVCFGAIRVSVTFVVSLGNFSRRLPTVRAG